MDKKAIFAHDSANINMSLPIYDWSNFYSCKPANDDPSWAYFDPGQSNYLIDPAQFCAPWPYGYYPLGAMTGLSSPMSSLTPSPLSPLTSLMNPLTPLTASPTVLFGQQEVNSSPEMMIDLFASSQGQASPVLEDKSSPRKKRTRTAHACEKCRIRKAKVRAAADKV